MDKKQEAIKIVKQMIADGIVTQDVAEKYLPELKATDKIYIDKESFIGGNADICWDHQTSNECIEYTRTDAFIEKACEFFEEHLCCYIKAQDFTIEEKRLENDFKNFMKGE